MSAQPSPLYMAAKPPGKKKRRRKKLRLSLKSSKLKKTDSYTDNLGWSTDVGRTLTDETPEKKEPETIKHQCESCGTIMKVPKPKKAKYTIQCPNCNHVESFN